MTHTHPPWQDQTDTHIYPGPHQHVTEAVHRTGRRSTNSPRLGLAETGIAPPTRSQS